MDDFPIYQRIVLGRLPSAKQDIETPQQGREISGSSHLIISAISLVESAAS